MTKVDPIFVVVGVIAVVALVMAPSIIESFGDMIDKGWDLWNEMWQVGDGDGDGNGNATLTTGYSALGLTVHYDDGTITEYAPETFSFTPLNIFEESTKKHVTSLDVKLILNADYKGRVTSNRFDGWFKYSVHSAQSGASLYSIDKRTFTVSSPIVKSKENTVIWSYTLVDDTIDAILDDAGAPDSTTPLNNYELHLVAQITEASFTFTDGTTLTAQTSIYNTYWEFLWFSDKAELNSVRLSIDTAPIY